MLDVPLVVVLVILIQLNHIVFAKMLIVQVRVLLNTERLILLFQNIQANAQIAENVTFRKMMFMVVNMI